MDTLAAGDTSLGLFINSIPVWQVSLDGPAIVRSSLHVNGSSLFLGPPHASKTALFHNAGDDTLRINYLGEYEGGIVLGQGLVRVQTSSDLDSQTALFVGVPGPFSSNGEANTTLTVYGGTRVMQGRPMPSVSATDVEDVGFSFVGASNTGLFAETGEFHPEWGGCASVVCHFGGGGSLFSRHLVFWSQGLGMT